VVRFGKMESMYQLYVNLMQDNAGAYPAHNPAMTSDRNGSQACISLRDRRKLPNSGDAVSRLMNAGRHLQML
jgi:hypothetical protein